MTSKFYAFLYIFAVFSLQVQVNSQNTASRNETPARVVKSTEQLKIENEIIKLKHEDRIENLPRILELNSQLGKITGTGRVEMGSILSGNNYGSLVRFNEGPSTGGFTDEIQNTRIFTNDNRKIKGIAATIEQRGSTAGKIWSVVIYSADSLSPDTLKVYYSLNNGLSWNLFVSGNIRPGDLVTPDDMDMELVENTTGQKYLWVAFGFKQISGRKALGAFILQVPSLNGSFFNILEWSASDSSKNYYNVRLTSDNARYTATPYVFLACSFDSLDGLGNRVNSQKFARILNPYSLTNPAFSFMAPKYYWYDNSSSYQRTSYTDIAYFNNGGEDSVEVSFCGVPDSTKIYFAKSDINGNPPLSSTGAGGNIGGSDPTGYKTHARLSSNGNDNGSIVCAFRQLSTGNWNVKYFPTSNYGNFTGIFNESPLLGSFANQNCMPEIVGVRNGSTHYITFLTDASEDSIHFISVNSLSMLDHVYRMNYFSASDVIAPKPLFRYQSSDSCLMFYSEEGPKNMISSAGCQGVPIGLINNQLPAQFSLLQNYPNPFNPVTRISFSVPSKAHIRLVVFDVQGREVAVLADSEFQSGNYDLLFNGENLSSGVYFYKIQAGGYQDIKKMVLLK
ncbi:MAG: T9SS type A sorting domain-containing protein [Ignavibacteria bacterium]